MVGLDCAVLQHVTRFFAAAIGLQTLAAASKPGKVSIHDGGQSAFGIVSHCAFHGVFRIPITP
jgi:hypothetical protein